MIKISFLICFIFLFSACGTTEVQTPRYKTDFDRNTCNSNSSSTTIDQLEELNQDNAYEYIISGTCERDNSELKIFIESHPLDKKPICNRKKWEVTVDLTGIINKKKRIQIGVSQAGGRGLVCTNVKNYFLCPTGYIGVPPLDRFTRDGFCVMQFEAKTKTKLSTSRRYSQTIRAESLPKGNLIQRITETEAIKNCRENGPGYELINNDHWQTIARYIEMEDSNWSLATTRIGNSNRLNIGNTGEPKNTSNADDINDNKWDFHNRYHKLRNGEYIWDFSGNLAEIVILNRDSIPETYNGFIYQIPQELQNLFGPYKKYSIIDSRERSLGFGGLGWVSTTKNSNGVLLRGGSDKNRAGIFSANTTKSKSSTHLRKVGFRCIYSP